MPFVDGDSTLYFDVKSWLTQNTVLKTRKKRLNMTTYYKDYKEVKVKIPYNTVMNVGIELDVKIT
jgi:hypothetical protein